MCRVNLANILRFVTKSGCYPALEKQNVGAAIINTVRGVLSMKCSKLHDRNQEWRKKAMEKTLK